MIEQIYSPFAHAGRNAAEKRFHKLPDAGHHVGGMKIGPQKTHAAIDVVAHAAGRNHAAFFRIGGRNAADAKTVAPVDIGHGQTGHLDARQKRHVGHLLRGLVVADLFDQFIVGKDPPFHAHADFIILRNPPSALVDLFQRPAIAGFRHFSSLPIPLSLWREG